MPSAASRAETLPASLDETPAISLGRTVIAYAAAHFGKSLFWYAGELLFAFYLTEVAGLQPVAMGVAVAIGLLVSAAIDLGVGFGLGAQMRDPASVGRLQRLGSVASALFLSLVFLADRIPPDARLAYAIAAGVGFRVAYALYDVPQNTLLGLMDWPGVGRGGMSAIRLTGSGLASILVSCAIGAGFGAPLARLDSTTLLTIIGAFAIIAVATATVLEITLRRGERAAFMPAISGRRRPPPTLWPPVILTIVASASFSFFTKLAPYFGVHTLGSARWAGVVVGAFSLGALAAQPLWAYIIQRTERRWVMAGLGALLILSTASFMASAHGSQGLAALAAGVLGVLNGGVNLLLWRWVADAAAEDSQGLPAVAFAIFSSASKAALAAAGLVIGCVLQVIDYRGHQMGALPWVMAAPLLLASCAFIAAAGWSRKAR